MKYKLFFLLLLCLGINGCGNEGILTRTQVAEIVFPSEPVVTAPPNEVFDAMGIVRADKMEAWKRLYPLEASDFSGGLTPAQLETHEAFKRNLDRKLNGVPLEEFDLLTLQEAFYTKYIDAGGIAIVANADVEDKHLIEARRVVLTMTSKYPSLRKHLLLQHGFYMILVGPQTPLRDIPERLSDNNIHMGCSISTSVPGFPRHGYCYAAVYVSPTAQPIQPDRTLPHLKAFAHEFAHALETEMEHLAPGFKDRVRQAYETAHALGTWAGHYADRSSREYWAEGVVMWFYEIGPGRQLETYAEFAERDAPLAELLSEWFPAVALPRHY